MRSELIRIIIGEASTAPGVGVHAPDKSRAFQMLLREGSLLQPFNSS